MRSLTDIHTHILPGMDDGAQDLQTALNMLKAQKQAGVDRIFLTPHYYPQEEEISSFLSRRDAAWKALLNVYQPDTMPEIRLGAEVRCGEFTEEDDVQALTLGGSRYLLLELSGRTMPRRLIPIVDQLTARGITPVIAHVERCVYFRNNPELLRELVHIGALAQVSAHAVFSRHDKHFARACLKNGIAHMVASDTHDLQYRSPDLAQTMEKLPAEAAKKAEHFAQCLWGNSIVPTLAAQSVEKGILGYR